VTLLMRLPALVNAHIHGVYGPQYRGLRPSLQFEEYLVDVALRDWRTPAPEELHACALVTGLENLSAGCTAVVDHHYGPLTAEHVYAVARAYEEIGLRAWVLIDLSDLPYVSYTRERYPHLSGASAEGELPEEVRAALRAQLPDRTPAELVKTVADLVGGWKLSRVRLGLGLGNPVWASDELLERAAQLIEDLGIPLTVHAEESPLQRRVSLEQWGMSGIARLARFGLLSERTLVSHAVQIDADDIQLLAGHGASVSHNPISNLKLQNGIAPVGRLTAAGVNVCLGSDGQNSADSQSIFSVMKFVSALAGLNGLRDLDRLPEDAALAMATSNGYRLWWDADFSGDFTQLAEPLGPYAFAWDDPVPAIAEVYVEGEPRLEAARETVRASGAQSIVLRLREEVAAYAGESFSARYLSASG
jgi:5-methylthioadenosine/S-adenosylhomocysteine deaminase